MTPRLPALVAGLLAWGLLTTACGGEQRPRLQPGPPGQTTTSRPPDDSADAVKARIRTALASLTTAEAQVSVVSVAPPDIVGQAARERRWTWARSAKGDYQGGEIYIDGATSVIRAQVRDLLGAPAIDEITDVALGPPDAMIPRSSDFDDPEIMARAVLDFENLQVTNATHDGRPAWVVQASLSPLQRFIAGPDHVSVTIDQATGLAVVVLLTTGGRPVQEVTVTQLVVNRPFPPDRFSPPAEGGQRAARFPRPAVFRRMSLDAARRAVGFEPPVPSRVPDGFVMAEVAVGPGSVASIAYRRGLDSFFVTARPRGSDPAETSRDRLFRLSPFLRVPDADAVTLRGGRLDRVEAQVFLDPFVTDHLYAATDGLVFTVAGDLTQAEFVDVAQSLS